MDLGLGLSLASAARRQPPFWLGGFLAGQAEGLYFDATRITSTWQDTAGTTPADDIGEAIGRVDDLRSGTGSPHNATQSTSGLRPVRQAAGAKFDGSDDTLATNYVAGSGANFLMAYVAVPATISATQYVMGCSVGSSDRFALAFNTSGRVAGAVGAQTIGTIFGGADLRGTTVAVAMSCSGSNVKLFADTSQAYNAAQSGSPTVAVAINIGSLNNSGVASGFFSGTLIRWTAGREHLTLSRFLQLRNPLIAA
jgi:hypothetical protein